MGQISSEQGQFGMGLSADGQLPTTQVAAARALPTAAQKDNAEKSALLPERIHQGRLSVAFDDEHWLFKTQGDLSYHDLSTKSLGYMIAETMGYRRGRLRAFANIGYFNTDDFNSKFDC